GGGDLPQHGDELLALSGVLLEQQVAPWTRPEPGHGAQHTVGLIAAVSTNGLVERGSVLGDEANRMAMNVEWQPEAGRGRNSPLQAGRCSRATVCCGTSIQQHRRSAVPRMLVNAHH